MIFDYDVAVCSAPTDDGWYGIQAKGFGGEKAGIGFDSYQPQFGFASRPLDATIEADGTPVGCLMFKAETGNAGGFAWFGHDVRFTKKCPDVTRGSSVQWNARGAYIRLDYESETLDIEIPATEGGKYQLTAGKDSSGRQVISLKHSSGKTVVDMTADTVTIEGPTVHVKSPKVVLGNGGKQVACVGDLVSVSIPPMANAGGPVAPVNPLNATTTGGVAGVGVIISGRGGVTAG